ncbi:type I DNA topoisomerase [Candidatus Saccharibacteria bacterium]|nr:type I DNA topoisomerase [Candidatus Saccharibacteria bacterium]
MPKNVVIVESPAKAKTIEKYLGKDYQVLSSYGHIRDLPKSGLEIDVEKDFEPTYVVPEDKAEVVAKLKKAIDKNTTAWLATDEDREGEAIAWHLCKALGLSEKTTKRIVFHEITKPAIEEAIKNPRKVDLHLVDAQQARRVLDRLVGYELSPVLWKKIRPGLSAGRVQSVAVRLIVEREREIEKFESKDFFKVTAEFDLGKDGVLQAELSEKLPDEKATQKFLESVKDASWKISGLEQKPGKKSPSAPFTTSTLQQTASTRLGFSVRQTMTLAQRLYEAGHITYMRTDSVNLSAIAVKQAAGYIEKKYGKDYVEQRAFKTKSAGAQEAHEAIRPTDMSLETAGADERQTKLYKLIRARALATQMADAKLERTIVTITTDKTDKSFVAKGEIVLFDGFLKVYGDKKEDKLLPPLKEGATLKLIRIVGRQSFERPAARYTEASLVKKLEEEGIGRPSTYAPTISTIQAREYVLKGEIEGKIREVVELELKAKNINRTQVEETYGADKNKLVPTDTGLVVTDFLVKFFPEVVDYGFTAKVEKEFDEIATGQEQWNKMIADFYKPFHKLIKQSEDISRHEANQGRKLGNDPKTGKPVIARMGRYGAMIQIGQAEDDEKPKFAPMPEGKKIDEVSLKEALEMFKLPRKVGATAKGEEITANIGRFGPYVKVGEMFVSIKGEDPFQIDETTARKLIAAKQKQERERIIQDFADEGLQVLNGRYGPYVTDSNTNAKVPKDKDPKKLSLKECQKLVAEAKTKPKRFGKK